VDFTRRFKAARYFYNVQVGTKMKLEKMAKADDKWDDTDAGVIKECHDQASGRLLALLYMENADQNKYGPLWTSFPSIRISTPRPSTMPQMC
jgi:hypothetical protein